MNVSTWIKDEPSLLFLHPESPMTSTNLSTEEFAGPLGFEINVNSTGNKSKGAQVRILHYINLTKLKLHMGLRNMDISVVLVLYRVFKR